MSILRNKGSVGLIIDPGGGSQDDAGRQDEKMRRESDSFQKKKGRPPGSKNKPKAGGLPELGRPSDPEPDPPVVSAAASSDSGELGLLVDEPVSDNEGDTVPILIAPVPEETIVEPTNGPGPLTDAAPAPNPSTVSASSPTVNWRLF